MLNGCETMVKALAMISGGLDSILAARLMMEQGIEVIGVCYESYFFRADNARKMAKQIGMPLITIDFSKEHMEMVKNPKHGHGKNMNPCIDCHAMMMKYTGEILEKYNADFIITGEVLNQRPMSQNKISLDVVKKESGFGDKILRPLCALNLQETKMEKDGLVDRSKLMDLHGRTRTVQMELAEKWGIVDYPSPAGGCKLTEPNYSNRLRELLSHNNNPEEKELTLLKIGRHFRTNNGVKIISTRTEEEGQEIKKCLTPKDTVFLTSDYSGSFIVAIGNLKEEDIEIAASICGRYSKGKDEEKLFVKYGNYTKQATGIIEVKPFSDDDIKNYII